MPSIHLIATVFMHHPGAPSSSPIELCVYQVACVLAHSLCKIYITPVTKGTFARWACLAFRLAHSSWPINTCLNDPYSTIWLHLCRFLLAAHFADNIGGAWLDFRLPAPYCTPTRLSARHDKEARQGPGLRPSWHLNLHGALRCWQADLAKVGGRLGRRLPLPGQYKGPYNSSL